MFTSWVKGGVNRKYGCVMDHRHISGFLILNLEGFWMGSRNFSYRTASRWALKPHGKKSHNYPHLFQPTPDSFCCGKREQPPYETNERSRSCSWIFILRSWSGWIVTKWSTDFSGWPGKVWNEGSWNHRWLWWGWFIPSIPYEGPVSWTLIPYCFDGRNPANQLIW